MNWKTMMRIQGQNPDYYSTPDKLKSGYSFVASQQNPNPVSSYTHKTPKKGGGHRIGATVNIYKKDKPAPAPRPAPRPAPKPAPAPAPAPKPAPPVVHSPEIKQAKERVNKYQSDIKEGKVSEEIYGNKDYSKNTYINRNQSKQPEIFDFSKTVFGN